jgi:hypothetical protein
MISSGEAGCASATRARWASARSDTKMSAIAATPLLATRARFGLRAAAMVMELG